MTFFGGFRLGCVLVLGLILCGPFLFPLFFPKRLLIKGKRVKPYMGEYKSTTKDLTSNIIKS